MSNYGQDPNFPILNHFYNSLQYGNWPAYPYLYHPTQIARSFYPENVNVDESGNNCVQIKKEQKIEFIQIQTHLNQNNLQKRDCKKKDSKNKFEDTNYINKCQKADRNLNSIVIRNFANFVNGHPKLLKIVEDIILKRKLSISAQDFKKQFREKFPLKKPYVGVGKLRKFLEHGKQHRDVRIITLILLRKFVSIDFFTVMLNSRKVAHSAKEKELKHGKKFWRQFSLQYL